MPLPRVLSPTYSHRVNIAKGCLMGVYCHWTCSVQRATIFRLSALAILKLSSLGLLPLWTFEAWVFDYHADIQRREFKEARRDYGDHRFRRVSAHFEPPCLTQYVPLAVSDGEGGAHSHHFVLNRCIPFRADVCCNLGPCCPGILVSVNSI